MMVDPALLDWLLDADPALRWQVERDLAGAPQEVWEATRAQIAREGFGARLLALQDPDGQWAGGAYFPGDFDFNGPETAEDAGQPWTATTWTLNTLRDWGLAAAALAGTADLLAANSRWEYDDLPYWGGEVDCCINAYTLANGAWLGADVAGIAQWFLDHRLADGGWNCEWVQGSTRSSFHSTLNALNGLLYYETATGGCDALRAARQAGENYLLERRLLRTLSTGELVGPWVTGFAYPFRWFYSVLNAAEYFRTGGAAGRHRARSSTRGCHRSNPRRPPARRHLAAATPPPRAGLVRGRRAARRAVQVAHVLRHTRTCMVGSVDPPRSRLGHQPPEQLTLFRDKPTSRPALRGGRNRQIIGSPFCSTRWVGQFNRDGVARNIGTPVPSHEAVSWLPWEESPIPKGTINLCVTS